MKAKKLLVTLGASFAMCAALVSCGFAQEGEAGWEDEIKTIDLSAYADSYYQEGESNAPAAVTYLIGGAESDTLAGGLNYPVQTSDGTALDAKNVEGLNSVTYTYFNRDSYKTCEQFFLNRATIERNQIIGSVAPTAAGEYYVLAHFDVDTNRFNQLNDWVAMVNIYHESPYGINDLVWEDKNVPYVADTTQYQLATFNGITLPINPNEVSSDFKQLVGISSYSYSFTFNGAAVTPQEIVNQGTYVATLTFKAKEFYQLPTLEYGVSVGTATQTTVISSNFTVSYSTKYGTAPSPVQGSIITAAMLPTLADTDTYAFGGWYFDEEFTKQAEIGDNITTNTTLYAKWTATKFTVTFVEGGFGQTFDSLTDISKITSLPTPTHTGYDFVGWFTAAGVEVKANDDLTNDVTLYAKWRKNTTYAYEEDFAYTNVSAVADLTVTGTDSSDVTIKDGKLNIVAGNNAVALIAMPDNLKTADSEISFKISTATVANSWGFWQLVDDNNNIIADARNKSGKIQFRYYNEAGTQVETTIADADTFAQVANTEYTVTINVAFVEGKAVVSISMTDGNNTVSISDLATRGTSVKGIRFGNANTNTGRDVTVDDIVISNPTV